MLFTIDIGNTNIVSGIFKAETLKKTWRVTTHKNWTADEMAALLCGFFNQQKLSLSKVKGVAVSSVVPVLTPRLEEVSRRLFKCKALLIDHKLNLGIKIKTDDPSEIGADRLVNAAQAWQQEKKTLLVLDMGTAITVDAVNKKGEYLGGVIAPGVSLALEALVRRAAKISRVELKKPYFALGSNTADSVRAGIYHGTVGQVRELLKQCAASLDEKPVIYATGGWAQWVPLKKLGVKKIDPDLTLKGLRTLYLRNKARLARVSRKKTN